MPILAKKRFFLLAGLLVALLAIPFGGYIVLKQTPQVVRAQGRLKYYGVDYANSGEFGWLKQQGVNLVMVALSPDRNTWASYFSAAEANGIKLIIWPSGDCYGVPWCRTGSGWDLSAGREALEYAQQYVEGGGTGLLAVMSSYDPFRQAGLDDPVNQIKSLYTAMKGVAEDVEIFAHVGSLSYFENGIGTTPYPIENGMWDWVSIWLHCFGGGDVEWPGVNGTCEDTRQRIRDDRDLITTKGLNIKLLFALQSFELVDPPLDYQMPTYNQLHDFACDIIERDELDGVFYYPWRNPAGYSDVLYNHPELHGVIRDVYDECIQGLPPGPPSPSPTPSSTPTPTPKSPTPTPPPIPSNAFRGQYYDNKDFTALTHTRIDPVIDFDWGLGSPAPAVGEDSFSVRWKGDWDFTQAGTYRFTAETDDGIRVWVDGQKIIDSWIRQSATVYTADINLSAGAHRIKVDYYEGPGDAVARLSWVLTASTLPGDLDKDGDVDIFDYNLIIQHFGNTSCGNVADIDGNCKVDIFDYNILIENFGKGVLR